MFFDKQLIARLKDKRWRSRQLGQASGFVRAHFLLLALWSLPLSHVASGVPDVMAYVVNIVLFDNLNEVVPGEFYRSGRMNPRELRSTIKKYGIKSVVDLRLSGPANMDYGISEQTVVEGSGATYYHAKLRSTALPTQQRVKRILRVVGEAEKPVLVHCDDGVHRSAFATAVWLLVREGWSVGKVADQFDLRFGYFTPERQLKRLINGEPTINSLIFEYVRLPERPRPDFVTWLERDVMDTLVDDPSS